MQVTALAERIDASAERERNSISAVLAVMLVALAVYPAIVYFGFLPPTLLRYLDVLFR